MRSLSSPFCALLCLAVLAVLPCFPVSFAVAPCCRVVLCCRALLSFCGAVCACFALLWPVVRRRAVLCCAVGCRCCFLPSGGVCVLWCPFPPCRQAQKKSIITLCYPASFSVRKSAFLNALRHTLVVLEMQGASLHFYLSIGPTKTGDNTF